MQGRAVVSPILHDSFPLSQPFPILRVAVGQCMQASRVQDLLMQARSRLVVLTISGAQEGVLFLHRSFRTALRIW